MKKSYRKPLLLFEDFTLLDALAANCSEGAKVNHADGVACYLPGGPGTEFPENLFTGNANCVVTDIEFYENMGFVVFSS